MTDRAIDTDDHAAGMDRMYRYTRHVYDLTRKYYLLGRDGLVRDLDPPPGGSVLEIGCGTGRNLLAVARRYPDVRLYGVDISEEMLKTARAAIAAAGLAERITVARADAVTLTPETLFDRARFDRVYFSYALSMIPDWRGAFVRASGLLAENGRLLVVDFGDFGGLPKVVRALMRWWLTRFGVTPRVDPAAAFHGRNDAPEIVERDLHLGYSKRVDVHARRG